MAKSIRSDFQEKSDPPSDYFTDDPDVEFGGTEARRVLEKKLLRKVDMRVSILIIIYILNYVCIPVVVARYCD